MMINNPQILIERIEFAGVPCLVAKPVPHEGLYPTLLLYHGLAGSIDNYRFFATQAAKLGMQVVCPEIPLHGERAVPDMSFEQLFERFWEAVIPAVEEGKAIYRALIEQGEADPAHIGIVGHSMGGFISSSLFAQVACLTCLVNINGGPAWEWLDTETRRRMNRPALSDSERAIFRQHDPMQYTERLYPRPILLMHGSADTSVPIAGQQMFHQQLVPKYAEQPERLKFIELARLDHYITLGMLEEMFGWLESYL